MTKVQSGETGFKARTVGDAETVFDLICDMEDDVRDIRCAAELLYRAASGVDDDQVRSAFHWLAERIQEGGDEIETKREKMFHLLCVHRRPDEDPAHRLFAKVMEAEKYAEASEGDDELNERCDALRQAQRELIDTPSATLWGVEAKVALVLKSECLKEEDGPWYNMLLSALNDMHSVRFKMNGGVS